MKFKITLLSTLLITILLTSCSKNFYQVYNVKPDSNIKENGKYLLFEDENCIVKYNFWSNGGNSGFNFYNKTNKDIFINLDKSFFIYNGIANNYFKNRTLTEKTKLNLSTSINVNHSFNNVDGDIYLESPITKDYSVSFKENKIICIPSKTSKIITEYNVKEFLYEDCDFLKYPTKKNIESKSFIKSESPIIFSNRICYQIQNSSSIIKFENEFYISKITNYPESKILESRYEKNCNEKSTILTKHFKNIKPNQFYIKYSKKTLE